MFSKPRRLVTDKHKTAKAEFQHMLALGIIRPSSSPYAPLHMVPKAQIKCSNGPGQVPRTQLGRLRHFPTGGYSFHKNRLAQGILPDPRCRNVLNSIIFDRQQIDFKFVVFEWFENSKLLTISVTYTKLCLIKFGF